MGLPYVCENPDCDEEDQVMPVELGQSADCPSCGWSMVAVPPHDGRMATT